MTYDSLTACVAMSLYQYNVAPGFRAEKLYSHFEGMCNTPEELLTLVDSKNWATAMPMPTAKVYLSHALAQFGDEAVDRIRGNE